MTKPKQETEEQDPVVKKDETPPESESPSDTHQAEEDVENILPYCMDGTSVGEISIMANEKYSESIMNDVYKTYDLKKIQELRGKDADLYLTESRTQILNLWGSMEGLVAHTHKYAVRIMMNIGNILHEVEDSFKKKAEYTRWLRRNFEDKHIRYFQQSKQLATIGKFAEDYSAAGKNRILQIEHQRKVEKKDSCYEVFQEYPLPDTTEDEDGEILKHHLDTVTTLKRLKAAGIDFCDINQAALIASFRKEAISAKDAAALKSWLDDQEEGKRNELLLAAARKGQKQRSCPLEVYDLGVGIHVRHLFQRAESFPAA